MSTIFLLTILIGTGPIFGQMKTKSLTLEECILSALRNNLSVAVQVLNPEISDYSVSQAEEKFMPSLSLAYNRQSNNSASYSWLNASGSTISKYAGYSVNLTEAIPTGGSVNVSLNSYKNDSNQRFQTINPRYGSTLTLDFTQPLLRDFGFKMSRRQIIVAQNNLDISEKQFSKTLLDTIYQVEQAYWNLFFSIEDLKVKQQSLKLAQDLLANNQREVEIGTMAPLDILSAQSEVATREADILTAEALVKNNQDALKTVINFVEEDEKAPVDVAPVDKPNFEEKQVSLEQSLLEAMQSRPDLQATRIGLNNNELNLSYAKNQLLPGLSLAASYWSPGVSGDQILYYENNPLTGIVIGRIPGGPSNALKDAFNFKYKNWSVGLTLDFPLSNALSRANYSLAKATLEQAQYSLKNQEQQVLLEIKNAVRAVQTNFKRVNAYKVARELAEKKLQAEQEKLKVGMSTNFIVLTYQRDLATTQSAELRAIIDYNLSLANLDKAQGTTLKAKSIKVTDFLRGSN
jgi:outer membrane protein TolC